MYWTEWRVVVYEHNVHSVVVDGAKEKDRKPKPGRRIGKWWEKIRTSVSPAEREC